MKPTALLRQVAAIALAALLFAWRADAATGDPVADARVAVDAMLACARPDGGWTYVCNPPSGPHGIVTRILIRARQIESWLGGPRWDVLVVRSPGTPAAGLVLLDAWTRVARSAVSRCGSTRWRHLCSRRSSARAAGRPRCRCAGSACPRGSAG